MPVEVDEDFIRARVEFDLAVKSAEGNHSSLTTLSFRNVQLLRDASWLPRMVAALAANTYCTELDLCNTRLTDVAVQQLAAALCLPSKCPKLKKLNLSQNPGVTKQGEVVVRGLCKLRPGIELVLDDELDAKAEGFVCNLQLVAGLTSWECDVLKPEGGGQFDFFLPDEVAKAAGAEAVAKAKAEKGTAAGERLRLTRGFQGPNGTRYKSDGSDTPFATFEHFHSTGNMVLTALRREGEDEGVVV